MQAREAKGGQRWHGAAGFCRDCDAPLQAAAERCPACGSPRLVVAPGVFGLAIAHVDCDAFFASIEKRDNPAIADRPVIVGGGRRGVVAAACYIARASGVRSAMPMTRALKLCPQAVVIRPDHEKYRRESAKIAAILESATPLVEMASIDEAYLDLAGTETLHGAPPAVVCARLARRIEQEVGITVSIGLSYNKFLAKMASDLEKPRGFSVISREQAADFLGRLKVEELHGVGPAAARALAREGITTVAQLRERDVRWLMRRFGRLGAQLYNLARGIDERPVQPEHERKSISAEHTFEEDISARTALEQELWRLCRKVMRRALEKGLAGRVVTCKLRTADFTTHTAQTRLAEPVALAVHIFPAARRLLARLHDGGPCRLIGVGISDLVEMTPEMLAQSLDERAAKKARAELASEALRRRFGENAVDFGLGLGVGLGPGLSARCVK